MICAATRQHRNFGLLLALLLFQQGCALMQSKPEPAVIGLRMQYAVDYLEFIRGLGLDQKYRDECAAIDNMRQQAEMTYLSGQPHVADRLTDDCLAAGRSLVSKYYRETVIAHIRALEAQIKSSSDRNSDRSLEEFMESLAEMAHRPPSDAPQEPFSAIQQVVKDIETLAQISANLESRLSVTISVDDLFEKQTFRLTDKGRRILDEMALKSIDLIIRQRADVKRLYFRIVGYTDQMNFGKDSRLLAQLMDRIDQPLPENQVERRRLLNRRLSELRAEEIARHIDYLGVEGIAKSYPAISVFTESIGKGEEPPVRTTPPFPIPDPRRRICRIYIYGE